MKSSEVKKPQFKLSQSFYLRDGWLDKAFREIETSSESGSIFSKSDGPVRLGLGTNMVIALRYWMDAANLLSFEKKLHPTLSPLGELLSETDPYLESKGSWEIIHANLVGNICKAPLFYFCFNVLPAHSSFSKNSFATDFMTWYKKAFKEEVAENLVKDDFSVLTRSYCLVQNDDPEDNLLCPLSSIGLLREEKGEFFVKTAPSLDDLDPWIFYYLLLTTAKSKEDSFDYFWSLDLGPAKLFNLDRDEFMEMLGRLKTLGLISIVRTAGLNVVKLEASDFSIDKALKTERA